MSAPSTADWMKNLPQALREKHISQLAIPGTHDSGAFFLDQKDSPAPDAPDFVKKMSCVPFVKRISANWGVTQGMNFTQQLEAGVRYLDLRVAAHPDDGKLYLVHTLYGPKIEELLASATAFLDQHPGEIIMLDFNHFYNMTSPDHEALLNMLLSAFGSKLCDVDFPLASMTLDKMQAAEKQVIVFYQCNCLSPEKAKVETRASISSPWANTPDPAELISYLQNVFADPPRTDFVVCQGVVTPTVSTVLGDLCGSLHRLNSKLSPLLVPWLASSTDHLNIIHSDFVGEADFIATVLARNHTALEQQEM